MSKAEELAMQYADSRVKNKKEYELCEWHRRKQLTTFDGYDIEQAYEDGYEQAEKDIVEEATEWVEETLMAYLPYQIADELTADFKIKMNKH